ncbi:glutamate--cysteine ligase regulatory subunit [Cylas formicarius]|uniref:glutamate--cysteine ligase regulatory subunit n=1 Tax=Cylas formicarius TaxID=197179 RepID=UPI002958CC11|nr:glutamate--cysteine ligase regulatory subunit [Cylas formicarius]
MAAKVLNSNGKLVFSTGNILSINDLKKKPAANPKEELIDVINYTLKEYVEKGNTVDGQLNHPILISRDSDLYAKIEENGVEDLKIGFKVFLSSDNEALLKDAIENALKQQLKVDQVDNIIVAFNGKQSEAKKDCLNEIKSVWKSLEKYVDNHVVKELGIADIDESAFRALYEWAVVKPKIIQINLATCCIVPPTLQQFCKDNDIKLLTHSDSSEILSRSTIQEIFNRAMDLEWAVRFTIHIKCRGVLTTKGYVLCFNQIS